MHARLLAAASLVFALSLGIPAAVRAAEIASTAVGQYMQVFPGDRFYQEGDLTTVPILELAAPFQSKMPGESGFSFKFAIDSTKLQYDGFSPDGRWAYLAAPKDSVRAWHGLIGNVMALGDHAGVRVNVKSGAREWYVNNSIHNGSLASSHSTVWSRPINAKKDVAVRQIGAEDVLIPGARMRRLQYLGLHDGQMRIRYEEIGPEPRTEEFRFPVEEQTPFLVGILGLRAEVSAVSGSSARIKVLEGFNESGFASLRP